MMDTSTQRIDDMLRTALAAPSPYPLLVLSITGSHLYGCASPHSDYDLHGVHLLPARSVLGLGNPQETIERKVQPPHCAIEAESATHDLKKCLLLLLKGNGNMLETLHSPQVIVSTPEHVTLLALGKQCITKQCAAHYKGMSFSQQRGLKARPIKAMIHMYRCLLTGMHLMRTGELVVWLPTLAQEYQQPALQDLIARKTNGDERPLSDEVMRRHQARIDALAQELDTVTAASTLPEHVSPEIRAEAEQFLVRTRLATHAKERV